MRNLFASVLLSLGLATCAVAPANAEVSVKEGATILSKSVAMARIGTQPGCTAFKVADKQYMSAGHCTSIADRGYIEGVSTITYVTRSASKGQDWAIFHTRLSGKHLTALEPACDEELYLGMPVAYMGYPVPVNVAYGTGHITSLNNLTVSYQNTSIVTDLHASHGASGSPVISLDSGKLIGVLIEGVKGGAGFFMVGLQDIKDTPLCQNENTTEDNGQRQDFAPM